MVDVAPKPDGTSEPRTSTYPEQVEEPPGPCTESVIDENPDVVNNTSCEPLLPGEPLGTTTFPVTTPRTLLADDQLLLDAFFVFQMTVLR